MGIVINSNRGDGNDAMVRVGGGRHRRSIFLVSEKRQLFRWSTGTVSCVNNILGNTAKIGR